MNGAMVTEAVRRLRAQGERISVRSGHAVMGGSLQDISNSIRWREQRSS
jgi:hypothetical protein